MKCPFFLVFRRRELRKKKSLGMSQREVESHAQGRQHTLIWGLSDQDSGVAGDLGSCEGLDAGSGLMGRLVRFGGRSLEGGGGGVVCSGLSQREGE